MIGYLATWILVGLYAAWADNERIKRLYPYMSEVNNGQFLLDILLGPVSLFMVMTNGGRWNFWTPKEDNMKNNEQGYTVIELIITSVIVIVLVVFCLIPFIFFRTDEPGATRALSAQGITHVHVTGYRFYGCGDDYHYHTGFSGIGADGKPVTGVVCRGYTKWFGKPSSVKID